MKPVLLFLLFVFGLASLTASCQKNNNSSPTNQDSTVFMGKWSIVSDSLANINGYNFSQVYPVPGRYIGVPGDYWEFLQNGQLKCP